jgi:hypothetical protein
LRHAAAAIHSAGGFDVDLSVEGSVLLCRQRDQPGIVGTIGMLLAKDNININFMTVGAFFLGGVLRGKGWVLGVMGHCHIIFMRCVFLRGKGWPCVFAPRMLDSRA